MPLHSQQQHHTTSQPQQLFTDPQSEGVNAKHGHGGRGYQCGQQGRGHHHGYSQNRRWHQQHRQPGQRNTKETDSLKEEENEYKTARVTENTRGDDNRTDGKQEKTDGGKVSLLQSSKERLRRRLKEKVSGVRTFGGGDSNIDAHPRSVSVFLKCACEMFRNMPMLSYFMSSYFMSSCIT